ncbi:hypothetical protein E2C01_045056 [Portunus trituberculatus]|uniref:Uncharacterized protein n=1 Tax=Portunus trituberculatus TaxID=210409 RepID=A0A5B7G1T2_PORTR|nr:hypothetical protein [Portunus trituberculatus]
MEVRRLMATVFIFTILTSSVLGHIFTLSFGYN